jgi:FtsH-binding integral membrane protein
MGANRRKINEAFITVAAAGAGSSSAAASQMVGSHEAVIYFVTISAMTGSITLGIDISPDNGVTWHALTAGELLGNTASIAANGNYHISSNAPVGQMCRLSYTIVTGPATLKITPVYEKSGGVF